MQWVSKLEGTGGGWEGGQGTGRCGREVVKPDNLRNVKVELLAWHWTGLPFLVLVFIVQSPHHIILSCVH